jgi:hypothetical protein
MIRATEEAYINYTWHLCLRFILSLSPLLCCVKAMTPAGCIAQILPPVEFYWWETGEQEKNLFPSASASYNDSSNNCTLPVVLASKGLYALETLSFFVLPLDGGW